MNSRGIIATFIALLLSSLIILAGMQPYSIYGKIFGINSFKGTPKELYKLEKDELLKINEIEEKDAEYILNKFTRKNVDRHIDYMKKNNIDIININDKEYPKLLRKIYDPPISLYIKGNKNILNNSAVAIIGCREATEYGKKAAKYFSYNIVIVLADYSS